MHVQCAASILLIFSDFAFGWRFGTTHAFLHAIGYVVQLWVLRTNGVGAGGMRVLFEHLRYWDIKL